MNEHFGDRPQFPPWRRGVGATLDEWTGEAAKRRAASSNTRSEVVVLDRNQAVLTAMTYLQARNITVVTLAQLLHFLGGDTP